MSIDFQENRQLYNLPPDDNEIFESMHQDDAKDIAPAIYKVLDKIQAPFRTQLIKLLEDVDEKYHRRIEEVEIDKMNALLFDEQNQEKFITAKGLDEIAKFIKKEEHHVGSDEIADFDSLNATYRSQIKNFLNTTTSTNHETPLIHACVWGKIEAADILVKEGADIPNNILQKTIMWSGIEMVNWVLDNGVEITPQNIIKAKECGKEEIAQKLEEVYKKAHPDCKDVFEIPKPIKFKEYTPLGTSRIGKSRIKRFPDSREGR